MAAWLCALVACLNAASWSLITPPFQAPDEPDHFAYVKQLAETGTRPTTAKEGTYAPEEIFALEALHFLKIRQDPAVQAIFSRAAQRKLDAGLKAFNRFPEKGSANAGSATAEPPLYYALESVPYSLGSSGTLLDRLQLMRLLSVLFAGFTVLFTFLFLREILPGVSWAWRVGALGVGLSPLFGFMSGVLNPDAMLFAVSAALLFCIARALRRGLTTSSAIVLGLVIAAGLMTKINFVGLVPGAFLALGILALREVRSSGWAALRVPAIAAVIGCAPVAIFVGSNALAGHAILGTAEGIRMAQGPLLGEVNYIWQFYLPRIPGTVSDFTGMSTTRQLWFNGYVGRFGWLDTFFPAWVYSVALIPAGLIGGLTLRGLLVGRAVLRDRVPEIAVYAVTALGVMMIVGATSYVDYPAAPSVWGQTRYLLPMLPLFGAVLVLAVRGAGRRWGPAVGTLIVCLFLAHNLFSQLQVVARYYG